MRLKFIEYSINCGIDEGEGVSNTQVSSDIRRTLAKDYFDGHLRLHIHIRFFDGEEYCASFDRNPKKLYIGDTVQCPDGHLGIIEGLPSEQEVSVLIKIAESMECPQVGTLRIGYARLKRINDFDYCTTDPLELAELAGFVFVGVLEDGELVPVPRLIPGGENELPDKMVEGRPVIVKHFPDTQTEVAGYGRHISEAIDVLSRCIIEMIGDTIRIEVTEGHQVTAQRLTLLSGPVEFSVGTFEGCHYDKLQEKDTKDSKSVLVKLA